MKKILLRIAGILLFISVIFMLKCNSVNAYTYHTLQEAYDWATSKALSNWWEDVDNDSGCQCVDLILAYYKYLVGYSVSGDAKDYQWNALPEGWIRTNTPTPGDIVVWNSGASFGWKETCNANVPHGHIGIVYAVPGDGSIWTVETNAVPGRSTEEILSVGGVADDYARNAANVACYIHPDFYDQISNKPSIPTNILNLGDNFYSYILMNNDVTLFNVDVDSQVVLQKGVWQDTKQAWNFIRQSDGSYMIKNSSTGKYLEVPNTSDCDGGVVKTSSYTGESTQKFYIYGSQDRAVIRPACSTIRTLSIDGGKNLVGKKLNMWEYWEVETQLFNIWKIDDVAKPSSLSYNLNGNNAKLNWTNTSDKYNIIINKKGTNSISLYKKIENVTGTSYEISLPVGIYEINIENWNWCNHAYSNKVTVDVKNVNPSISYTTHVQKEGWQNFVTDGATSGTTGKSLRLEGIKIKLDSTISGGIKYSTHVQKEGWQNFVENGALSGTTGKGYRLEAIKIELTGEIAKQYDIYYRVHAQKFGWMGWTKNGEQSGTQGYGYRLEGIQIKLVKKGETAPTSTTIAFSICPTLKYSSYVQKEGWKNEVSNGQTMGTTGKGLRMEALKINLKTYGITGGIKYTAHVQKQGWQNYVTSGKVAGTTGKNLRMEAIKIELTEEMAKTFDIYYRVHTEKFGWLGWAKNGEAAGTQGYGYRVEAMQIQLLPKGSKPSGSTANALRKK